MTTPAPAEPPRATPGQVFAVFLRLGLTSFGGPVAHLGYFRAAFVERRQWLGDAAFADLVALCQFLPGPASSQVGFAIGLARGGWAGGLAAWAGFTLPSALLMLGFAYGADGIDPRLIHGLKLAAVAVVAQAVIGMARMLTPDLARFAVAGVAAATVALLGEPLAPLAAIAVGGLAGVGLCRDEPAGTAAVAAVQMSRRAALAALLVFAALFAALPGLAAHGGAAARIADACYRAGALVFGGGHVVLPLLQANVVAPGWVAPDAFLAGYGAAQALPGPLFSFATFLGAKAGGLPGALAATLAIFLPGLLLLVAALPFWDRLRGLPGARGAMAGANAAVVGVLAAALVGPVATSALCGAADLAVAFAGLALLLLRVPPVAVVAACALAGLAGL